MANALNNLMEKKDEGQRKHANTLNLNEETK